MSFRLNAFKSKLLNHRFQANRRKLAVKLRNRKIGQKLNIAFGILIVMTFLVIGRNYLGGREAQVNINRTQNTRVPTVLASAQAQANLLKMLSQVRAYVATGDPEYRYRYQESRQKFEADLAQMEALANHSASDIRDRVGQLKQTYQIWSELPDQLIALRDDLLENQPALKLLDSQGKKPIIIIQREIEEMLDDQQTRSPSATNTALLRDMAEFQSSFALLISALQSYLVTRSPSFRFEYNALAQANQNAWQELVAKQQFLTAKQRTSFDEIANRRTEFFRLPPRMFEIVESDRYRQELFLLKTQAEPLAEDMLSQLDQIVTDQQLMLAQELKKANRSLNQAQWQTLIWGIFALILAIAMAFWLRRQIAEPIKRLTDVTRRLQEGDLSVKAAVNSTDEVGELADSFNRMSGQLQHAFVTLEDKVTERTAQLATANQEIQALNQKLKTENLRMSAQLDIVRQMQHLILPKAEELQCIERLDIAGFMEPADEVGGDYYDVLYSDGVVTIGIGDVTGHGLESGILMLMTQMGVRTLKEIRETDPIRFLDTLNRTIYKNVQRMNSDKNLTLAILNYAQNQVSISGQHEETIVVRKGGKIERIDTLDLGFPIGLEYEISEFIRHTLVPLNPGDGIVLYTDGITEAENINRIQYGIEKLCQVVSQNWQKSAEEIKQAVIDDVRRHIGQQKVFDDITLLVLKQQ
ncbi:SpoIIE family protein phosphatase [Coleofasciculus sp. E2-BRE-01]|uniref:SpoIIE family protein phosphatase n=1 Tax=Coleofasciculus sp. E2-BRE-01 TaxID=3069524 RepID=UPI0032F3EAA7